MTIEEMDEIYSNLKTEYFDIQDKLTTAEQCVDCYKRDILKLNKQLEIAVTALKDTERKLLTIDVSNLSSLDRDRLYNIMFHDGVIDKALDKIKELEHETTM